jgi:hypothetical protein
MSTFLPLHVPQSGTYIAVILVLTWQEVVLYSTSRKHAKHLNFGRKILRSINLHYMQQSKSAQFVAETLKSRNIAQKRYETVYNWFGDSCMLNIILFTDGSKHDNKRS